MGKVLKHISDELIEKMTVRERKEFLSYRNVTGRIKVKERVINKRVTELKKIKSELKSLKKEQTELLNRVKVFDDEFNPTISIVQNKKGKNLYWNCIIKIRGTVKSIYLGRNKKIREYMKTEHNTKLNVSVSRIKDTISFEIQDNVWEMIREDYKSFMTNKLTLEDILD